jgi:hypothetical protein
MDTALIIIVIAAAALLVVFLLARRASAAANEKRRRMASDLRVESTRAEERARRAEVQAEEEREAAAARATRADRIDPDTDTSRRRFGVFGRHEDDSEEKRSEDEAETSGNRRPRLRDRLLNR